MGAGSVAAGRSTLIDTSFAMKTTVFKKFASEDSGATAIEYGLIAAMISVAIIVTLGLVSDELDAAFLSVLTAFQ
jgi:pilus assembly protein Flp/PilA